jgi:hypothetical protein
MDENKTLIVQVDLGHCHYLYVISFLLSMFTILEINPSLLRIQRIFLSSSPKENAETNGPLMVNIYISDYFDCISKLL